MKNNSLQRVGLLDIAKKAGYSPSTVSYVLSGQAIKKRVAEKTAKKILKVAQNLHYVPNQWAQNLRRKKTGVVSILFGELSHDWAGRLMKGLIDVLDKNDYTPFVGMHLFDPHREQKELRSIIQRSDEGVICHPLEINLEIYETVIKSGIPLLFLDAAMEQLPNVSYVAWDVVPAVRVLMGYLLATGRRKIGLIGANYPSWSSNLRYSTYLNVMRESGCQIDPEWVYLNGKEKEIGDALKRMFRMGSSRPDSLFVMNDYMAMRVVVALENSGVRVPDDIAVVGMGDFHEVARIGAELTTVSQPVEEIGKVVAQTLLELIECPENAPIQKLVSGAEMKIRKTA